MRITYCQYQWADVVIFIIFNRFVKTATLKRGIEKRLIIDLHSINDLR